MKGFINSIRAWFRDEERGIASLTELSPLAVLPHAGARLYNAAEKPGLPPQGSGTVLLVRRLRRKLTSPGCSRTEREPHR